MAFRSMLKKAALIDEIPQDANVSLIRFALICFLISFFPPRYTVRVARVKKHELILTIFKKSMWGEKKKWRNEQ